MTLVLSAGNPRDVVMVTDRRISVGGRPIDDETGKLTVALVRDARVGLAYSGLAAFGQFKTRYWLGETLANMASKGTVTLGPVLEKLRDAVEAKIRSLRLRAEDRRLTITIAGFQYESASSLVPVYARISNFEGDDDLGDPYGAVGDFSLVSRLGMGQFLLPSGTSAGVDMDHAVALRDALQGDASAVDIRAKMVHLVQRASQHPRSADVVGPQCLSLILPGEASKPHVGAYHTTTVTRTTYLPGMVEMRGGQFGVYAAVDQSVTAVGDDPRAAFVPVVARKSRCPCGSGLQYRRCHGRSAR